MENIKPEDFLEKELYILEGTIRNSNYSKTVLEKAYNKLSETGTKIYNSKKLKAEICYLLAQKIKDKDIIRAKKLALESIKIYEDLDIKTIEESIPILDEKLPEYMHEGVVKERLKDVLK